MRRAFAVLVGRSSVSRFNFEREYFGRPIRRRAVCVLVSRDISSSNSTNKSLRNLYQIFYSILKKCALSGETDGTKNEGDDDRTWLKYLW